MPSSKLIEESEGLLGARIGPSSRSQPYKTWVTALWPLVAHGIISIGITFMMIFYIDGNYFNIDARRPSVTLADGTTVPWVRYTPLQSDITTLVSTSLAFLRLVTACWLGPLCWRCAFILLEKTGLHAKHLYIMISYGVPAFPRREKSSISWSMMIVLIIILPIYISGPVLTGSITWIQSMHRPERLSDTLISIPATSNGVWRRMHENPPIYRQRLVEQAAGLALSLWGRNPRSNAMSRAHDSISRLAINSTLASVMLPYFSVTALEWVKDPRRDLSLDQRSVAQFTCAKLGLLNNSFCEEDGLREAGMFGLIPDAPWNDTYSDSSVIISERRLLLVYTGLQDRSKPNDLCLDFLRFLPNASTLHEGIVGDPSGGACWAFARATYTAGAGLCLDCRVSSYATIQADAELMLSPDQLTDTALAMTTDVIDSIMKAQSSYMRPAWDNIDDYVIGLLSRAYAASWATLSDEPARRPFESTFVNTTYSVSPTASRAVVNLARMYIWLGLQGLVTLSGVLFLYVQTTSGSPMIGDTTLTAFFLDSHSVYNEKQYEQLRGGAPRRVEPRLDGLLHMKVE